MTPAASMKRNVYDDSSEIRAKIIDSLREEISTNFKRFNF